MILPISHQSFSINAIFELLVKRVHPHLLHFEEVFASSERSRDPQHELVFDVGISANNAPLADDVGLLRLLIQKMFEVRVHINAIVPTTDLGQFV